MCIRDRSAKEAVFKSMGVESKGAGAGMKDIEILSDEKGAPVVKVCLLVEWFVWL